MLSRSRVPVSFSNRTEMGQIVRRVEITRFENTILVLGRRREVIVLDKRCAGAIRFAAFNTTTDKCDAFLVNVRETSAVSFARRVCLVLVHASVQRPRGQDNSRSRETRERPVIEKSARLRPRFFSRALLLEFEPKNYITFVRSFARWFEQFRRRPIG